MPAVLSALALVAPHRLATPLEPTGALAEVQDWLAARAPHLPATHNLLRPGQLAFVYPAGLRAERLALFAGLATLWRTDRAAAEAVLCHELAHARRGDARVLGAASPLEALVRLALLGGIVLIVGPAVALLADQALRAGRTLLALGMSLHTVVYYQARQVLLVQGPGLALIVVGYLLRLASYLVLPVAAIWSAEIERDRGGSGGGRPLWRGSRASSHRSLEARGGMARVDAAAHPSTPQPQAAAAGPA